MKQVRLDIGVRIEAGSAGGEELNLGRDYIRSATWATNDPNAPFLTAFVVGFVRGQIETPDETKVADLEWGTTFWPGERVRFPGGHDESTAREWYFATAEFEVIEHTERDDAVGSTQKLRLLPLSDPTGQMPLRCTTLGEAELAARQFVEAYRFDAELIGVAAV